MGSIGTARASPGSARRDLVSALYVPPGGQWPCSWHLVWQRACDFGVSPAHSGGSPDEHFDSSRSSIHSVLPAGLSAKKQKPPKFLLARQFRPPDPRLSALSLGAGAVY